MASDLSGLRKRPLKPSQECRVERHVSRWEMEVPAVVLLLGSSRPCSRLILEESDRQTDDDDSNTFH